MNASGEDQRDERKRTIEDVSKVYGRDQNWVGQLNSG